MSASDAKQISRQLRDKEQIIFYEKIFSTLHAIVFVFDFAKYKMVWTSDGFKKILGYKKPNKAIPSEDLIAIHHPDDNEFLEEMHNFFKKNPKGTFTAIFKFRNAQDEYIWLCTSANLFRKTKDDKTFEVVGVSIDYTNELSYNKNLKSLSQEKLRQINGESVKKVTKREKEILKYFAKGNNTKEIAETLDISYHTVNNHRKNLLKKLNLKNLASLVNFAVENGLD